MPLKAVSYDDLRSFATENGKPVPSSPRAYRFSPVLACPVPPLSRCCGPTVGLGRVFPGELVVPAYCPPALAPTDDQRSLAAAFGDAMRDALRTAIVLTQPSPLERPGFRGRRNKITSIVVVHNGSSDDALLLSTAFRGPTSSTALVITTVNLAVSTVPLAILTYQAPDSMQAIVESVTISSLSQDLDSTLLFSATRSGLLMQPPFMVVDALAPIPLDIPLGAGDSFVLLGNMIGDGALLLKIQLDVFLTPLVVRDDSFTSRVIPSGRPMPQECR